MTNRCCRNPMTTDARPQSFRIVLTMMLVCAVGGSLSAADRFRTQGRMLDGPADWVSIDKDRVVLGADDQVTIASIRPTVEVTSRYALAETAVQGVIAGDRLYLIQQNRHAERLVALAIDSPSAKPRPIRLDPVPKATLHLAQMDDYLLLAEDGYGIRILEMPGHRHEGHDHHPSWEEPIQVGFFPVKDRISAIGSSVRTIYAVTEQGLLVLDATIPTLPGFVRSVPVDGPVRSLAANGPTVFLLGDDGLRTINVSSSFTSPPTHDYPEVRGQSILLAGRSLYVAGGADGLQTLRDQNSIAATFFVQVGDVFFDPPGVVNVSVGDTVQWQKPATAFTHNVFSCTAAQIGCGGTASTESFSSGPVTSGSFIFSHTFSLAGSNPYLCQSHRLTMTGDINVTGGPGPPPAVPDGRGGSTPMSVTKLDSAGADLSIQYDTGCPDAAGHDIIYGDPVSLPSSLGGTYALTGARCGIGTRSPFTWTLSPQPAPGEFLWWVIVADDGASTEGSWGKDVQGGERNGSGIGGASGQCANTDKDLTNVCGQ